MNDSKPRGWTRRLIEKPSIIIRVVTRQSGIFLARSRLVSDHTRPIAAAFLVADAVTSPVPCAFLDRWNQTNMKLEDTTPPLACMIFPPLRESV